MSDAIADALHELIVATRILSTEKILDAFGHVSVRHPGDPQHYFIPRHRAPELAEISDLVELTLDSEPVRPTDVRLYSERVIHGEIYKARARTSTPCAITTPTRCCPSPYPADRSCRCFISAPWSATCRSGTSATSSATPTCW
jgi:hypothetical protein